MKKFTKQQMSAIVEEARQFGDCYLGEVSFDVIKDTKKWNKFLRDNQIDDCFLTHRSEGDHNDGWFLICP